MLANLASTVITAASADAIGEENVAAVCVVTACVDASEVMPPDRPPSRAGVVVRRATVCRRGGVIASPMRVRDCLCARGRNAQKVPGLKQQKNENW